MSDYVKCPTGFDAKSAAKDSAQNVSIAPQDDKAGLRQRAKLAEVYLVKDENNQINQIVLPVYGTGLWSQCMVLFQFNRMVIQLKVLHSMTMVKHQGWEAKLKIQNGKLNLLMSTA